MLPSSECENLSRRTSCEHATSTPELPVIHPPSVILYLLPILDAVPLEESRRNSVTGFVGIRSSREDLEDHRLLASCPFSIVSEGSVSTRDSRGFEDHESIFDRAKEFQRVIRSETTSCPTRLTFNESRLSLRANSNTAKFTLGTTFSIAPESRRVIRSLEIRTPVRYEFLHRLVKLSTRDSFRANSKTSRSTNLVFVRTEISPREVPSARIRRPKIRNESHSKTLRTFNKIYVLREFKDRRVRYESLLLELAKVSARDTLLRANSRRR